MSRAIDQIWEHQETFQWYLQHAADRLFPVLDSRFEPKVFVLAFRKAGEGKKSRVEFIPPSSTFELPKGTHLHTLFARLQEESNPSTSVGKRASADSLSPYELQRQLTSTLNDGPSSKDTLFYCSLPCRVRGAIITVVLALDRAIHDAFPTVPNELDRVQPYTFESYLEAVVDRLFAVCAAELRNTNPGHQMPSPNTTALLADAGRQFAARPVFSGGQSRDYSLFDHCCKISALQYEGLEVGGQIVIQPKDKALPVLKFTVPVEIASHRATRKLLELCTARLCLLSERGRIYGLAEKEQISTDPSLCSMQFLHRHTWELMRGETVLMRTILGEPSLPQPTLSFARLEDTLRRRFSKITAQELAALTQLIARAAEQRHGTIVVISAAPAAEAKRFTNQGMMIEPTHLNHDWISAVTKIDGAVLVGVDGTCHAIGLILDGAASPKGTPARGARYNSALRYVRSNKNCVAVVISEDRTIDVLPELQPQIKRSELETELQRLREFETSGERPYDEYMKIMWWFETHRFYLQSALCDEVNSVVDRIGDDTAGNPMQDSIEPFVPDEDMDDSYFI